jgi:hypothetical protein
VSVPYLLYRKEKSRKSRRKTPSFDMTWELSRRRIVRSVNERFIFGKIVRLRPPAPDTCHYRSGLIGIESCWTLFSKHTSYCVTAY